MKRGRGRKLLTLAKVPLRQRQVAAEMARAMLTGSIGQASRMARTAAQKPDLGAEKIVSHRHRALWLCVPKAASRSTIAALTCMDPAAELIRDKTIADVYSMLPQVRSYTSFAFIRHPFDRALSLYAEMRFHCQRFEGDHLTPKVERQHHFAKTFYGLADEDSFDGFCEWLNTPYGSDMFADRHFLSQHLQIRLADGRLPNFIGRVDNIEEDLKRVASRLGMKTPALPMLNTVAGWSPTPAAIASARASLSAELNDRNKALLRQRYAEDLTLYESVAEGREGREGEEGEKR